MYITMIELFTLLDETLEATIKEAYKNYSGLGVVTHNENCINKRIFERVFCSRKKKNAANVQESSKQVSIQTTCYILVKIEKKEHMERLLKYGEVYMNSTDFFRIHDNPEIGDRYEGALYLEKGQISKYRDNLKFEKLFCMWHINNIMPLHPDIIHRVTYDETASKKVICLDFRKLCGFTPGETPYMVVITNVKEFNKRFKLACKRARAEYVSCKVVQYYEENLVCPNKKLTPFFKRSIYSKQQEIKYLVKKETDNALILKLESLEDIAKVYNVNEFSLYIIDKGKKSA